MYIFGYGSLMSADSAKETLVRDISASDLIPVILSGYRRNWTLKERVISDALGKEITAVFLDIEIFSETKMNGVLIEVSQAELNLMKLREKNYDCINVTSSIIFGTNNNSSSAVFTFISKPENRVRNKDQNLYILKKYVEKVENACAILGGNFLTLYRKTTESPSFTLIDGDYTFAGEE